ncbi:lamin tail domain-containing protein [Candidatus Entotheonella palauensis]|uniref:LTD domain-containing protein n=1 Tax=Candidatus Entotheonella gemina TaxID=1429439 RepID=W4MCV0_9BACT|nr:lamin tail domain-containing protein [Candidatus Entotheonella palauensis]ETX07751.1 MAG: hypothetical protein ETSY2_09375 [Candidatus Entotheonella gemina]
MYRVIKGTFIIAREGLGPYEPDGDTVRFEADDPSLITRLPRRGFAPDNPASIRFEAIDALEKDQELAGAQASRNRMFELLGLGQQSLDTGSGGFRITSAEAGESRGYVLANGLDRYGRVIAFVFGTDPAHADGASIDPQLNELQTSVNAKLLEEGLVYATFYSTLSGSLRDALATISGQARTNQRGIWARAVGTPSRPAQINRISDLSRLVLFPTLHRRLDDFLLTNTGFDDLAAWIRAEESRNKTVRILQEDRFTDLPGILQADGPFIRLTHAPEDFIFVDGPPTVVPEEETQPQTRAAAGDIVIAGALVNPVGPERGAEAITLLNTTNEAIDLAGWTVNDNAGVESLQGVLPGGRTSRIVLRILQLRNRGDFVELKDDAGTLIDKVEWSSHIPEGRTHVFPWPRSSD